MKHLFKPETIQRLWVFLLLLFVVKLVWFSVEVLWLPATGLNHAEEGKSKALYYRVKLNPNEVELPSKKISGESAGSIKNISLLAIYNDSSVTVITVEHKGETKVMSRGEKINEFVLEGAGYDYALFSKNSKMYKIHLISSRNSDKHSKIDRPLSSGTQASVGVAQGDIVDNGDIRVIDKELIDHYAENIDDIYKNIGIRELKKGGVVRGFRISSIKKGSPFSKLGLKTNDVIKSINGEEMNSYNAAFSMYGDIKNIGNMTLVIIRGNKEMEFEYEIN